MQVPARASPGAHQQFPKQLNGFLAAMSILPSLSWGLLYQ